MEDGVRNLGGNAPLLIREADEHLVRRRGKQAERAWWKAAALLAFVGCSLAVRGGVNWYRRPQWGRRQLKVKSICKSTFQPYKQNGLFTNEKVDAKKTGKNKARDKDYSKRQKEKIREGSACTNANSKGVGLLIASIFIVLYLFTGIAIICDELFVAALEELSGRWDLDDDVSGATLMAAGGSAPELATSFVGTFSGSSVGLGTIVGSAVFNVLFVIGMCALQTPAEFAPLKLTWWPLFRDCLYYIVTLLFLAFWFVGPTVGQISWWEAVLQFCLYLGYVYLMANNSAAEAWVKGLIGAASKKNKVEPSNEPNDKQPEQQETITTKMGAVVPLDSDEGKQEGSFPVTAPAPKAVEEQQQQQEPSFNKPSTFRAGVVQLLMSKKKRPLEQTAGTAVVSKIKGKVADTFKTLDTNNNGTLDFTELRALLKILGDPDDCTDERVEELRTVLDKNNDSVIDVNEFTSWYIASETRLKAETKQIFDMFDSNSNGRIELSEVRALIAKLISDSPTLLAAVDEIAEDFEKNVAARHHEENPTPTSSPSSSPQKKPSLKKSPSCTYAEFQTWYESTIFWQQAKEDATEAQQSTESILTSTFNSLGELPGMTLSEKMVTLLLFPINVSLGLTVPDCRPPGREHWCYATFVGSIVWIAIYAVILVRAIENIGCFIGVPPFIMGLIPLAAGTSVPDMLSSVIVAKQGKGDMAVSSSIGSNIFDVGVGLPIPWICFTILNDCPVNVAGTPSNTALSVLILLVMVVLVVTTVAWCNWEMSTNLGGTMFGLYFLFCAQELIRARESLG